MPLVTCPECGHRVSDAADACPNCGYPIAARMAWERARTGQPSPTPAPQPPPLPYQPSGPQWPAQKKQKGGCVGTVVTVIILLWVIGTCISAVEHL
jgi:uncharacterized membrane protein YvbJ